MRTDDGLECVRIEAATRAKLLEQGEEEPLPFILALVERADGYEYYEHIESFAHLAGLLASRRPQFFRLLTSADDDILGCLHTLELGVNGPVDVKTMH